jgi:hypothetical protein
MSKLQVSKRGRNVIASPIRKFLPYVQAAEKKGIKVIKVNVGDPDLVPPQEFFKVIRNYAGRTLGYTPSPGIPTSRCPDWCFYFLPEPTKEIKNITGYRWQMTISSK